MGMMNNRYFIFSICLSLVMVWFSLLPAQSGFPVRTEWRSPDNSRPITYSRWKAQWDNMPKVMGGEVKYRSPGFYTVRRDSFVFGNDYAYYKDYVRNSDGTLSNATPPEAGFVVYLNGDDQHILTDESPRWAFGDPNISGMGWFGIELGNFIDPAIAIGDTFQIVFTQYNPNEQPQQGMIEQTILMLPFVNFPITLHLQQQPVPAPPDSLKLERQPGQYRISWRQVPGMSYTVYRRAESDSLCYNFPRRMYRKIAQGIIDSLYIDSAIDSTDRYAYILFAKDLSSGLQSGHSCEIAEVEFLPEVRAVLVQPELYPSIQSALSTLVSDWEQEGAQVVVYAMQFTSVQALRDTLKSIPGLRGALLIGNFPVPWYQHCDVTGQHYQEFPVDLYYMDLDGIWEDNYHHDPNGGLVPGSDGIFDTHIENFPRNDEAPEVVVGRIMPTPGMGDAGEIINNYLDKVYRYRHDIGNIRQNFRALAYPDDDWHEWGQQVAQNYLSQAYPDYDCIWNINATTATDYRDRLSSHYSLIHVYVHSWSQGHAFLVNNGTQTQYFYNYQIVPANTDANFFLLFACGNCRYVEDENCGAVYALLTDAGINTIGSTHSGGMLDYDFFYPALAEHISYGEAFLRTLQHVGLGGFNHDLKGWYYGMTFNGDPFIIPQPQGATPIYSRAQTFIPQSLTLQNFPNPFNTSTNFLFRVPVPEKVRLEIYDVLGKKITTLVNKKLTAGEHRIQFDAGDLASGIYLYSLHIGNRFQVKKFVLMK